MTYTAVKFNFQQVLLKTLIPTMNTLKDMAVLNIIKTDGKCAPEAKREDLESNLEESIMEASWPSVGVKLV